MNELRQRVAAREEGRARVGSVTTTAVLASVVTAGAAAVALPGAAHEARTAAPGSNSPAAGSRVHPSGPAGSAGSAGSPSSASSSSAPTSSGSSGPGGFIPSPLPTSSSGCAQAISSGSAMIAAYPAWAA
ncbi:MAG: hypothetical protein WAK82_42360, partial [Streptosporangiaceae bacterium]